jgi:hypothetical protein
MTTVEERQDQWSVTRREVRDHLDVVHKDAAGAVMSAQYQLSQKLYATEDVDTLRALAMTMVHVAHLSEREVKASRAGYDAVGALKMAVGELEQVAREARAFMDAVA